MSMKFLTKEDFHVIPRTSCGLLTISLASCFLLLISHLSAQVLPPVQSFTPLDYSGEYQNWGISQSLAKNIFVANNSSLLEYDGVRWTKYLSPNRSVIRSVATHGDVVYTGCHLEFGYWRKDEFGRLQYASLSDSLTTPLTEDEQFWDILPIEELVLFRSLDRIYIYDTLERRFEYFDCPSYKGQLFVIDKKVFFQIKDSGLFTLENGKPSLITDATVFRENSVVGVFAHGEDLIAVTADARFYRIREEVVQLWDIEAYEDLNDLSIYTSFKLQDGSFILGSISKGIYQVSPDGSLIRHIDQSKGLNNNTVLSISEDIDGNLWLGLDNGISVINLYSPFSEYVDNVGRLGTVYTAKQHRGYLYLGTNQGLFYRQLSGTSDFAFIAGTKGQVWSLDVVHGSLFCGHIMGTFVVEGTEAGLISNFPGTWGVKPIPGHEQLILQGNFNGLAILEKGADGWRFRNKLEGFDISSRFFEMVGRTILVNHEYKGIYRVQADENLEEVELINHQEPIGYGSNIFTFQGQNFYKCNEGVYRLDSEDFTFVIDSTLNEIVFETDEVPISRIIPFQQPDRLWWFTSNSIIHLSQNGLTGKLNTQIVSAPSFFRSKLGVQGFENITPLAEAKYLIGIADGFVILDLDKVTPSTFNVNLNYVAKGSFTETTTVVPLDQDLSLSYKENSIHFRFAVPQYDKFSEIQYQYQLDGMHQDWSPWSLESEVSFSSLPYGNYEFSVRAKLGNLTSENIARFRFEILRPWYLSTWAIAAYILGVILLLIAVNKLYTTYYRKQLRIIVDKQERALRLKKLEANEKIIQMRNEKLQSEIESKNRELAISTMSIVNKNKFLYFIKDQLKRSKTADPVIESVLHSIDQNINSEDDWKLFETAFNHADKDFLQKVRARHDNLTPEDLRLCAYLRLNLSSKEIAPLLNISVKSVEMKRYRLRKKLDLPHEENLTEYILNLN